MRKDETIHMNGYNDKNKTEISEITRSQLKEAQKTEKT